MAATRPAIAHGGWTTRPRALVAGFTLLQLVAAAPPSVTVALVADVTQCLGVNSRQVELRHCAKGGGVAWHGTVESLTQGGKLGLAALEQEGGEVSQARRLAGAQNAEECLRHVPGPSFMLWPCAQTDTTFQWDAKTLQLKTNGKCLGVENGRLALLKCVTTLDGQDEVAPVAQSWVLLPTERPQIELLDTVSLPLRASGRYVSDSQGKRVKLAGVNWLAALAKPLEIPEDAPSPADVAEAIKYLGFNAVRIAYSDGTTLASLDNAVEAATAKKLLVVLSRQGDTLEFADPADKQKWLESLTFMARRYQANPRVVGIDIHQGPGMEEGTHTVPWWGVPKAVESAAQAMGFDMADWRTAAAEGAVAAWAGNPNLLVVIEGGLYGTDLMNVASRPLALAEDCLRSRVVFATQERRWFSSLFELLTQLKEFWNPVQAVQQIGEAVHQAEWRTREALAGTGREATDAEGSYEDYKRVRNQAAYYLDIHNEAPVWVSELSATTKTGNKWWSYTLRSLKESDASWFYSPMGGRSPRPDGLFNASNPSPAAVVGWKLQDLITLQMPSPQHPFELPVPMACTFEEAANEKLASRRTTLGEFAATTTWSSMGLLVMSIGVLLPSCAICVCFKSMCCRKRSSKPSWLIPTLSPRDMEVSEPLKANGKKSLWCCACQRTLPVQVPERVANMLPPGATVPSSYAQLQQPYSNFR